MKESTAPKYDASPNKNISTSKLVPFDDVQMFIVRYLLSPNIYASTIAPETKYIPNRKEYSTPLITCSDKKFPAPQKTPSPMKRH